jgi:hypothetical protein
LFLNRALLRHHRLGNPLWTDASGLYALGGEPLLSQHL